METFYREIRTKIKVFLINGAEMPIMLHKILWLAAARKFKHCKVLWDSVQVCSSGGFPFGREKLPSTDMLMGSESLML